MDDADTTALRASGGDLFAPAFRGTERFKVEQVLGEGAMGVVYRAFDLKRGAPVALKCLVRESAHSRYELKKEFRARQGLHHPNLITLYELFAEGSPCFFTMELVEGVPFCDYFRPYLPLQVHMPGESPGPHDAAGETLRRPGLEARVGDTLKSAPTYLEEASLWAVLRQVTSAIATLHRSGQLHRDIKPNNVLVTKSGRPVLLDFGLAQELAPLDAGGSYQERLVAGTPAYMAPEQAAGRAASTASDWYSLGTMLYQTLCGRLPFIGSASEVMAQKQALDPPPLPEIPGVSKELADLCLALLAREPARRPRAEEIARRLGLSPHPSPPSLEPWSEQPLIGRELELETLRLALGRVQAGRCEVVFVRGTHGAGTSRLIEHFESHIASSLGAVIFAGRCRPRERVLYKALDEVIDRTGRWLASQRQIADLLPRHIPLLLTLFPTLGRVPGIVRAETPKFIPEGSHAQRAAAFDALRELFARIADRHLLVIRIDDLRWADADGLELLRHLVAPTSPVCALFLLGLTSDVDLPSAMQLVPAPPALGVTTLALSPLDHEAATRLAISTLTTAERLVPTVLEQAKALAIRSAGVPGTLMRLLRTASASKLDQPPLGADASTVLTLLRIHGAPLPCALLAKAAGLDTERTLIALGELLGSNYCKVVPAEADDLFECTQDTLPTAQLDELSAEARRKLQKDLASAFEAASRPTEAARHRRDAGEPSAAVHLLCEAGVLAQQGLALDAAIALFDEALELDAKALSPAQRVAVVMRLATCLEETGRYALAATRLESAIGLADAELGIALTRRALLLRSRSNAPDDLMTAGAAGSQPADVTKLFEGLPRAAAEQLLQSSRVLSGDAGQVLVQAGTQPSDFYVVMKGEVALGHTHQPLALVGENSILGEVGFILELPRSVDVRASVDGTRVLAVDRAALEELAIDSPRVALRLVLNLARIVCAKLVLVQQKVARAQAPT